nr:GDSL esterase/lipase At5g03610-like [Ipomoea batatas]
MEKKDCFIVFLCLSAGLLTTHVPEVNAAMQQPQEDKLTLNGPKMFVFGDSYADTGNWPPTHASGSWREPYASYIGIGSPQPYAAWKGDGEAKQYGMNFAYGGSGVFDTYVDGPNMTTQISYLQQLLQQNVYTKHDLTSSVALVSSVGNDYNYHTFTKHMGGFVKTLTKKLSLNLKRIHEMGVRKVAVTAMEPLGCIPGVAFLKVNGARRQPQNKLILNGPEKLFVFGDSYADTGNWPPTDASRPWREPYAAAYLGIGSPQPYSLWKGDGEAKQYGMNFAYGGTGVFDTHVDGPNMTTQINYLQQLLQQNVYTKHDLTSSAALVTSVGNDYSNYHGNMNEFVDSITKQLCLDLKRIHEIGIPKVAVTAMQPLGCLPLVAFSTGKYPNCDEHTNNITRFHNQMLKQKVEKLNDQTEGSPLVILDLYAAFTSAMNIQHNHPGKSSFPHPLLPCCFGKCGDVDESGMKEYRLCDDPKMAFFWDSEHPSQQGWFAVYSALKSSLPHLFHPQQATPIENLGML